MASIYQIKNAPLLERKARIAARRADRARNPRIHILAHGHGRNAAPYRPAQIRKAILSCIGSDWIDSSNLWGRVQGLAPSAYVHDRFASVLEFLQDHFRIEQGNVYHYPYDPKKPRTTLESRMEEPPIGTVGIGHEFAYRLLPYNLSSIITLIDRLSNRNTREEHPRSLAEEFHMRPDFIWRLWHETRFITPEETSRIRNNILSRINRPS